MSKHNFSLEERVEIIERFLSSIGPFEGFKAEPEIFPAKRTIKGGWVNVYPGRGYLTPLDGPHPAKNVADAWAAGDERDRIACIQIPDFQEGEGL